MIQNSIQTILNQPESIDGLAHVSKSAVRLEAMPDVYADEGAKFTVILDGSEVRAVVLGRKNPVEIVKQAAQKAGIQLADSNAEEIGEDLAKACALYCEDGGTRVTRLMGATDTGIIDIEVPVLTCRDMGEQADFHEALVTGYFESLDDKATVLHMSLEGHSFRNAAAFEVKGPDGEKVRGFADILEEVNLEGSLAPLTGRLREAVETVSRMAALCGEKEIVKVFGTFRDPNGVRLANYAIEAPYYIPDPVWRGVDPLEAACEGRPCDEAEDELIPF